MQSYTSYVDGVKQKVHADQKCRFIDVGAKGGYAAPAFVDINGDGVNELVVGSAVGTNKYSNFLSPNVK